MALSCCRVRSIVFPLAFVRSKRLLSKSVLLGEACHFPGLWLERAGCR
jgi:hypothetical protein